MKFKLLIVVLLSTFTTLQSFAQDCAEIQPSGVFNPSDDILLTTYHQSMAKSTDGYVTWGEDMSATGDNQASINVINAANGYNFTGTPIHFAVSGNTDGQAFMATTTNLYSWGNPGEVVSTSFTASANDDFAVMPNVPFSGSEVFDMHASSDVLFVTLQNGTVWTATNNRPEVTGNASTNVSVWQQVQTSLGVPLTNVKQVTGNRNTGYALTNSGQIYAWGINVELGNGPGVTNYSYATLMNALPSGVTPTYISAFMHLGDGENNSGLLALGDNKRVYGVGENTSGRIITTGTGNVSTWTAIGTGGVPLEGVIFLATSHTSEEWAGAAVIIEQPTSGGNIDGFGIIRVWGLNNQNSLSQPSATTIIENPTIPNTFTVGTDNPLAVSVGGHAVTYFNGANGGSICFSGHIIEGSTGGLSTTQAGFECVIPANIELCGTAQFIDANNDTTSVIQGVGGTNIINVLNNDILDANQATTSNVTVSQISTTNAGVTLGTDGLVDVTAAVPTGIYTIVYQICETGVTPANCDTATVTVFVSPDSDGDGVPDLLDIDDDNDGIPDIVESGGNSPDGDEDGDGIPNYLDTTDNGNGGDGSSTNYTDADNDGIADIYDTDGDGIPNHLDLDSDNDGITDIKENGGIDTNNDGEVDYPTPGDASTMVDVDGDGLDDELDNVNSGNLSGNGEVASGTPLIIANNDNDSLPDYLDLDADNDGIPDNIEAQTVAGYLAPIGADANQNGVLDVYETGGNVGLTPENSDGQDNPDYTDSDSDNDGISDVLEAGGTDPDNDGIIGTGTITDADGDGLDDSVDNIDSGKATGEVTNGTPLADDDFDNDGLNNRIDLDSDNDGITDVVETGNGALDTNNDGVVNINDTGFADIDNNGQSDNTQTTVLVNTDGNVNDGVDYLDIDADDDGIPDNVEGQPTVGYIAPSGNDANTNGIDDAYEGGGFIDIPENTDNDIIPDYLDLDSDNDGTSDTIEAGQGTFTGTDTDGDGLDDGFDTSNDTGVSPDVNDNLNTGADGTDNDDEPGTGEVDFREAVDYDNDGTPDFIDLDDDNDGIPDVVESGGNNPDGDEDGDGIVNYLDTTDNGNAGDSSATDYTDADNNGIPDVYDTDGDGKPNHLDLDADNDGITDITENGGIDTNNDGQVDYQTPGDPTTMVDVDGDGLDDELDNLNGGNQSGAGEVTGGTPLTIADTDLDTIPNYLDIDADNDGIPDNVEAQSTLGWIAPSGVGPAMVDANDNGVDDNYETGGNVGLTPFNFDNVDTPDYIDLDADNDGTPDIEENGNANNTLSGLDTDGDGLDNNFDDNNDSAIAGSTVNDNHNPPNAANLGDADADLGSGGDVDYRDALDTDQDGIPDFTDIDDDNDGILDVDECDPEVFAAGAIPTTEVAAITLDQDVGNQQRILTQNNDGAEFDSTNDVLVVAFGATLPVGTKVVVRMANENFGDAPLAAMVIQQATTANGSDASNPLTIDGIEDAYVNYSYTISGSEATHLRISMSVDDGKKVLVDHVSWLDSHICITDGDTDGDGIINSLDLDSDNDGIPDNIEAQSTLGYIAPSGLDSDFDGLDDAYDATPNGDSNGTGSIGLNAIDTDSDNIPDYVDTDADNDGIFDVEESANPTLPNDGNGHLTGVFGSNGLLAALESADDYSDVNGIFDDTQADNFTDADNNALSGGNVDFRETADFDGDGIPDVDDLDDDNDGIPDLVEVPSDPLADNDLDGVPAYLDDDDNDLNVGNVDNATQPEFDTDGDGKPNHLDLDSDNDGITDIRENGGIDNNRDGEVDYPTPGDASTMVDVDGDGLDDELDNIDSGSGVGEVTGGTPLTIADTDGDTIPDYFDIDADNDGIPDNVEAQTTDGWIAPSGVGLSMTDNNNNGVDDSYEIGGNVGLTPVNFDGVDNPDYLDLDSDNDSIPDIEENGNANDTLAGTDIDGDGLDDNFDDNDDSAIAGSTVNDDHNPPSGANLGDEDADIGLGGDADYRDAPDTDGDGIIDPIDIDDDNDGILDVNECDLSFTAGAIPTVEIDAITLDENVGNQARILTQDDDGAEFDSVTDVLVVSFGTTLTPGSTVTLRMQNDGVGSTNEIQVQQSTAGDGTGASNPLTFNGITDAWVDYTYTILGTDTTHLRISMPVDGGQKTDVDHVTWNRLDCDANGDTDGDGIPNSLDLDSDNDGIPDNIEAQSTLGYVAATPFAPTGFDDDGDGLDNAYDATPDGGSDGAGSNGLTAVDTDGDGFPDFVDLDSDGDAIFDVEESADPTLANDGNGQLTGTFGDNGLLDGLEASDDYADVNGTFDDTQADNFTDEDGDVNTPAGDVDYRDTDFTPDTDSDGVPDSVDLDDDNDGISDLDEGYKTCPNPAAALSSISTDVLVENGTTNLLIDGDIVTAGFNFKNDEVLADGTGPDIFNLAFTEPIILTEIRVLMDSKDSYLKADVVHQIQGSEDGITWTDIGPQYTSDGSDIVVVGTDQWPVVYNISSNTTEYTNYRIEWVSGGKVRNGDIREIEYDFTPCVEILTDSDGDGIPDGLDSDSDNDGISDVIEAGGSDPDNDGVIGTGAITDADGDGFDDSVDDEDGGNQSGAGEVTNGTPLADGDFDGDGLNNRLDIDSDNDGITDVVESGNDALDTNNDGVIDSNDTGFVDFNDNGQSDNSEATVPPNSDSTGGPDYLDIDADDDGIPDNVEAQSTDGFIAPSGVGAAMTDANNNGLDDAYEAGGNTGLELENTDGLDEPDYLDDDSDNDGILDIFENGDTNNSLSGVDTDGDGLDDNFDDNDDSAIAGSTVNDNHNPPSDLNLGDEDGDLVSGGDVDYRDILDTDNDGTPDFIDIDDDNDGIPDLVETNGLDPLADNDGDGVFAYLDDDDNDDQVGNTDGLTEAPFDTDGDGVPNHLDLDADNDGITDVIEAGGTDPDNDGRIGSGAITDVDGDGLDDSVDDIDSGNVSGNGEVTGGTALTVPDTDADSLPNYLDIDADNDGIPDNVEGQPTTGYVAPSGVGTAMTDANNNGVDDNYEGILNPGEVGLTPENTDGADAPDYLDPDSDNDGILDIIENGDADNTLSGVDTDGDGLDDNFDENDDSGIAGSTVNDNHNPPNAANLGDEDADLGSGGDVDYRDAIDTDKDGIPDNIDIDDDNDGILDLVELAIAGDPLLDVDGDGVPAYLDDDDGNASVGNDDGLTEEEFDFDGDNVPNHLDLDSDNDGIPDNIEAQTTLGYIAPSGNDNDNDGLDDAYDADDNDPDPALSAGLTPVNTDGIDEPDYFDLDSDNDDIFDIVESGDGLTDANNDGQTDGVVGVNGLDDAIDDDGADTDADGFDGGDNYVDVNGYHDNTQDNNFTDTDGDVNLGGDVDYRDEACISLNLRVYLAGALINNGGATGSNSEPLMRDNLRLSIFETTTPTSYLPTLEPYTALAGFTHVGSGGGETATAGAFDDRGQNSVVDWVFVEFRDKTDNTSILETRSALVQRDGDVVGVDGIIPIEVCTSEVEYYVAVRHRNHFGVMTATAEDLRADNTVDFSDNNAGGSGVFNYGTSHPQGGPAGFDYTGLSQQSSFNFSPLPGGVSALWFGNVLNDNKVKYEAPGDDNFQIFTDVLLFPLNSSFASNYDFAFGYNSGDIDMNGKVKYEAPDDDQLILFFQVLGYSQNTLFQSNFDFFYQQLP